MPTLENVMNWEFLNGQKRISFTPKGRFIANNNLLIIKAYLSHLGIAWLPKEHIHAELNSGELVEILPQTTICYDGLYLYYPHRRQHSPLFKALMVALRV